MRHIACIASGPSLTQELVHWACQTMDGVVAVSDSFRLIQGQPDLIARTLAHVATDVRWWNKWQGDDFHTRIQHGDAKPYESTGTPPTFWKETPTGKSYLRCSRTTKLHSGALGLMVAADYAGPGGMVYLVSHDLELKDPGKAHFFGNHPAHEGWGTPNPTEGNLPLYRRQIQECSAWVKKNRGVEVVCATHSSLLNPSLMNGRPLRFVADRAERAQK